MKIKAIATVNDTQCICRACEGDFKRNADRDGYRFWWMVNLDRGPGSSRCIIASCTERVASVPGLPRYVRELFDLWGRE